MSDNDKLKFNKTINDLENKNPQQIDEIQVKRQKAKEVLIKQFNLTNEEAEEKLREIEEKHWGQQPNSTSKKEEHKFENHEKLTLKTPENYSDDAPIIPQHVLDRQNNEVKPKKTSKPIKKVAQKPKPQQQKPQKPKPQPKKEIIQEPVKEEPIQFDDKLNVLQVQDAQKEGKKSRFSGLFSRNKKEKTTEEPKAPQLESDSQDIDAILGEIVPNYSQDISVEVSHVDLTFEVSEDQIDNLKEQVIRTLKRNKSRNHKVHVLKDISFKIYQGEKVGIIGYNGAGKSTLLKLITGIYKPDNGTVTTNGKISPLLTLGAGFDNNFSGAKNIFLNGAILGYDRDFIEEKYDEILEFAELGEKINFPIKNYSSGMKAKLGFSIATMVDPDILIIDEILGVGDINFKRKSRDKMRSLMGGKTTVILVSHSIDQIRDICDKAIWIDDGRVREIGEVNEVCDNYIKDSKKATKEQLKDIQLG